MSWPRLGFAMLLGGCQVVFPLRDGEELPVVTGSLVSKHIENEMGLPKFSSEGITAGATVFFEDRTSVEVEVAADGTFSFDRATNNYRLELIRGADVFEIQENAAMLALSYDTAGRTNAEPFSEEKQLVTFPVATAGTNAAFLASTGQWTSTQLFSMSFDWRAMLPKGGIPLGLVNGTAGDKLYYLERTSGIFQPGQSAVSGFIVADGVMMTTAGGGFTFDTTLTPTTPESCTNMTLALPDEIADLTEALAGSTPPFLPIGANWAIKAFPGVELGNLGEIDIVTAGTTNLELQLDVQFFDPFDDHDVAAAAGSGAFRELRYPGAFPTVLFAGTEHLALVDHSAGCAANASLINSEVGFPRNAQLDGVPLVTDGVEVPFDRPGTARLTWEVSNKPVDYYDISLIEVLNNNTATELAVVRRYRTRERQLEIDGTLLEVGKFYYFSISPSLGVPEAATGNYTTKVFPLAGSLMPTAMFQAM